MSWRFATDPEQAFVEQFFKDYDRKGTKFCTICGNRVYTQPLTKHLRDGECQGFRESVRALQVAKEKGIELCPLDLSASAYKQKCAQLEAYLHMAIAELARAGAPLAQNPTMRQLVQPQASIGTAAVSTSTTVSKAAWSNAGFR